MENEREVAILAKNSMIIGLKRPQCSFIGGLALFE
jgi:hypothetical protein